MLVKRMVIRKARTSVVMCDQTKLSRLMPYTFAQFADVDYLISDQEVPETVSQACEDAGVVIL